MRGCFEALMNTDGVCSPQGLKYIRVPLVIWENPVLVWNHPGPIGGDKVLNA